MIPDCWIYYPSHERIKETFAADTMAVGRGSWRRARSMNDLHFMPVVKFTGNNLEQWIWPVIFTQTPND